MFDKVFLGLVLTLITLVFAGIACRMVPSQGIRLVMLEKQDFPEPQPVRGVLIYRHWDMSDSDLDLMVGNPYELERILGKKLIPRMTVPDSDAVRRISALYASVLSDARKAAAEDPEGIGTVIAISAPARIVFVTSQVAYVREFTTSDGDVLDTWMKSKDLWEEFERIGYLKE